ncbi:hypothetical protein PF005_g28646 [Phytophthora fragariae]|uniref:Secreted protein n=1 Tax=Phytophthora fragariae TaxID=53985 RepID=A0A6A3VUL2_9STRA|nr:hypothetical protein PF003_g1703 [Phytophthora fragariae]KAE9054902.1 hypothetical protein PF007_g32490 [Phytophthora fragariae]KAE9167780.1 hypothetical protein PF005_g28646 [Phytophthora fragariae]KAE9259992.1 hypothetical protein PF001_g32855 [Phytophthora fragariae]
MMCRASFSLLLSRFAAHYEIPVFNSKGGSPAKAAAPSSGAGAFACILCGVRVQGAVMLNLRDPPHHTDSGIKCG